jgi:hypothetical protein
MAYQVIRGVIYIETESYFSCKITNSIFDGCGNAYDTIQNRRYCVFIRSKNTQSGDFVITNTEIKNIATTGVGSGFRIANLTNVSIKDCYFENLDNTDLAKFLFIIENDTIAIDDNIFKSILINNYVNSRLISLSNSTYSYLSVSNNTFINKNTSSIASGIDSDYTTPNAKIVYNTFIGNYTLKTNNNIFNISIRNVYTGDNVTKYGISIPAVDTWNVGDRIINSNPSVGQPKSWVCTVAGTPGTWVSEGNL